MCDPVTAGLILTGVGTGTQAINNQISLRRQDRANAAGIRKQSDIQRKSNARVNERIADIAGNTGEAERAKALEGYLNVLRDNEDLTGAAEDPLGLGGERYAERVASGVEGVRKRGTETASRTARIDAPIQQRRNETGRVAGTALDLGELGRQSAAQDFITRLHVASKRPNPWVDALGQVARGAGSVVALQPGAASLARLAKQGGLVDPITGLPSGVNIFGTSPILPA